MAGHLPDEAEAGEMQGRYRGDMGAWPIPLGGWEGGSLAWPISMGGSLACLPWLPCNIPHLGARRGLVVGHVVDGRGGGGRGRLCGGKQHRGDVGHVDTRDVPG